MLVPLIFLLLSEQQPLQFLAQSAPMFSFENFSNIQKNHLHLTGNAVISPSSLLQLTSNNLCGYGRAMKPEPISFCTDDSPFSFTTEFTFRIEKKDNTQINADGLTFFIAPTLISPSNQSYGRCLGFVEPADSGKTSNHLVGIEFDTYMNRAPALFSEIQDMDDNHVGIDINGIISLNASSLTPLGIKLGSGNLLAVRIDYDASLQKFSVFVSPDSDFNNTGGPVLEHNINLCAYISKTSYVGLSAGSGCGNVDFHNIYSWKFTSRISKSSTIPGSSVPTTILSRGRNMSFKVPFLLSASLEAAAVVVVLLLSSYLFLQKTKNQEHLQRTRRNTRPSGKEIVSLPREIDYSDIVQATHNFTSVTC